MKMAHLRVFNLFKNHYKKTLFIIPTFSYGVYYAYDYSITYSLMKKCCQQATIMGDEKLVNFNADVRHVTVILNPIAGKRKAKKLYARWVEPLLHLSGTKVSLVETESANQASELMKMMSNCDAVAIVGGDGTVQESIDGLVSREDYLKACQKFPLAFIPVGQNNLLAKLIHRDTNFRNHKEFLILTTMALIERKKKRVNLHKIMILDEKKVDTKKEAVEDDQVSENDKSNQDQKKVTIYMLPDIDVEKYQEIYDQASGYKIYQNYIKPYWLNLKQKFVPGSKNQLQTNASPSVISSCEGCSKCCDSKWVGYENDSKTRRWWGGMLQTKSRPKPSDSDLKELELFKRDNPDCDRWMRINVFVAKEEINT